MRFGPAALDVYLRSVRFGLLARVRRLDSVPALLLAHSQQPAQAGEARAAAGGVKTFVARARREHATPAAKAVGANGRHPRKHMSAPDAATAAANPQASRRGMRPLLKAVLALLVAGSTLASAQLYAGACARRVGVCGCRRPWGRPEDVPLQTLKALRRRVSSGGSRVLREPAPLAILRTVMIIFSLRALRRAAEPHPPLQARGHGGPRWGRTGGRRRATRAARSP